MKWLRITPPACRAAPVREGIIKDRAPGNPDPVSRNTLPAVRTPSDMLTVRPPMRRHPSATPLANMAGCWMVTNCPHLPARAATIPRQHDTGRRTRGDCPYSRARPVGLRGNRHGYRKHSGQGQSERAHFETPVIHRARASSHNGSTANFRPAGTPIRLNRSDGRYRVAATTLERLLSVRSGDFRRDVRQPARRADFRPSRPRPGTRKFQPIPAVAGRPPDRNEGNLDVVERSFCWVRDLALLSPFKGAIVGLKSAGVVNVG